MEEEDDEEIPLTYQACENIIRGLMIYALDESRRSFSRQVAELLVQELRRNFQELDIFLGVVSSGGMYTSKCVKVTRRFSDYLKNSGYGGAAPVVCARIWRWPDLESSELKHLKFCVWAYDLGCHLVCINPYHYKRVMSSDVDQFLFGMSVTFDDKYISGLLPDDYAPEERPQRFEPYPSTSMGIDKLSSIKKYNPSATTCVHGRTHTHGRIRGQGYDTYAAVLTGETQAAERRRREQERSRTGQEPKFGQITRSMLGLSLDSQPSAPSPNVSARAQTRSHSSRSYGLADSISFAGSRARSSSRGVLDSSQYSDTLYPSTQTSSTSLFQSNASQSSQFSYAVPTTLIENLSSPSNSSTSFVTRLQNQYGFRMEQSESYASEPSFLCPHPLGRTGSESEVRQLRPFTIAVPDQQSEMQYRALTSQSSHNYLTSTRQVTLPSVDHLFRQRFGCQLTEDSAPRRSFETLQQSPIPSGRGRGGVLDDPAIIQVVSGINPNTNYCRAVGHRSPPPLPGPSQAATDPLPSSSQSRPSSESIVRLYRDAPRRSTDARSDLSSSVWSSSFRTALSQPNQFVVPSQSSVTLSPRSAMRPDSPIVNERVNQLVNEIRRHNEIVEEFTQHFQRFTMPYYVINEYMRTLRPHQYPIVTELGLFLFVPNQNFDGFVPFQQIFDVIDNISFSQYRSPEQYFHMINFEAHPAFVLIHLYSGTLLFVTRSCLNAQPAHFSEDNRN